MGLGALYGGWEGVGGSRPGVRRGLRRVTHRSRPVSPPPPPARAAPAGRRHPKGGGGAPPVRGRDTHPPPLRLSLLPPLRPPLPPPLPPPPPRTRALLCQANYLHLGIIIAAVSLTCLVISWPAWGGIFIPPRPFATEDEYYAAEWTPDERAAGLHLSALRFAHEASVHGGSQHGSRHGGRASGMGSRAQSKASLASLGKVAAPGDDSARGAKGAAVDGGVAKV